MPRVSMALKYVVAHEALIFSHLHGVIGARLQKLCVNP